MRVLTNGHGTLCLAAAILLTACLETGCNGPASENSGPFAWPGGTRAAVCLTYDDAIDTHLDVVMPDLEEAGLRGTFYVPGSSGPLYQRLPEWRDAAARGHELGNHTLFHPCVKVHEDGSDYDWVRPEYALESYTPEQIFDELRVMNTMLLAIDGNRERTLAYTCYDTLTGGRSFVDRVSPLFTAARAGGPIPPDLSMLRPYRVGCRSFSADAPAEEMIAYVEEAIEAGSMAVFTFHGVGGGHNLNVQREDHRKLLRYLADNSDRVWTATFIEAMRHWRSEGRRLGWSNGEETP